MSAPLTRSCILIWLVHLAMALAAAACGTVGGKTFVRAYAAADRHYIWHSIVSKPFAAVAPTSAESIGRGSGLLAAQYWIMSSMKPIAEAARDAHGPGPGPGHQHGGTD